MTARIILPEKTIIKAYLSGVPRLTIASKYNVSCGPIDRILREGGVKKRSRGLTPTPIDTDRVLVLYEKIKSIHKVAKLLKIDNLRIRQALVDCGIVIPPRGAPHGMTPWRLGRVNHDYFSSITTEEQAYWLGFIATDGCIMPDGLLSLSLNVQDREHLIQFRRDLEIINNVKIYRCKGKAR